MHIGFNNQSKFNYYAVGFFLQVEFNGTLFVGIGL